MTNLPLPVLGFSEQQLALLLNYIGWSYIVLWSQPLRVLEWHQGLWPGGTSYEQSLFYTTYKSCQFSFGQGHAGIAFARSNHLWITGASVANTSVLEQLEFLTATRIQTVLCIPLLDGVLEIGSTESIPETPLLLETIETFFYAAPPVPVSVIDQSSALASQITPSTSTSSLPSSSPPEPSLDISVLQNYTASDWATIYSFTTSRPSELLDSRRASAFQKWDPLQQPNRALPAIPQAMLKKMLQSVAAIHEVRRQSPLFAQGPTQILSAGEETRTRTIHIDAERNRRRKHKESISKLRSLVPFKTTDKLSVLRGTIQYVQNLHSKVAQLENDKQTVSEPRQDELAVEAADDQGTLSLRIFRGRKQRPQVMIELLNHLWSLGLTATSIESTMSEDSFRAVLTAKPLGNSNNQLQLTDLETWLRGLLI